METADRDSPCGSGKTHEQGPEQQPNQGQQLTDPAQAFDDALTHYEAGRLTEADAIYLQLLNLDPDDAEVWYLSATIAYQTAHYERALERINKSILITPNDPEALNLAALLENHHRRYAEALDLATRALVIAPGFYRAHACAGQALQGLQRHDEALASYRCALALNGDDPFNHLNLGNILQLQNKLTEANASFRQALAIKPDFFEAHCNLADTLQLEKNFEEAIIERRHAVACQPNFALAHTKLGHALKAAGAIDNAIDCYRQALRLEPENGETCFNLATALHVGNKLDDAIENYRRALTFMPKNAVIHNNLGIALAAQNKLEEAAIAFRQVIIFEPNHADAHNDLGNIYKIQNKFEEAVRCYRQAVNIDPLHAPAHCNLGTMLQNLGQLETALINHRQAYAIKPNNAMYCNNLATTLDALGKFDEAICTYREALTLQPDGAEIHNNLGSVLKTKGELGAAITSYRQAIFHKPDFTLAYSNLGNALLEQGKIVEAIENYRTGLAFNPGDSDVHSNLLMAKHYQPDYSPVELLANHSEFANTFEPLVQPLQRARDYSATTARRLKIGFVSGDLCDHPVGYFLESTLTHFDRETFDITLYSSHYRSDAVTQRLKNLGWRWSSLTGLVDSQAAQRIDADRIDILVDLSGHTGHNRLPMFAYRPAPVQISWLGYWATTGLRSIDYILCDPYAVAANEADHFIEQPWFLPDTRLCFTPPPYAITVGALPALTNRYITFGCFNNRAKINAAVIALWAEVLTRVANSRLVLKARQFSEASLRDEMKADFAEHGIAADRLSLEGPAARADYLATYNRIDIALDPFPFTGGATSIDGLWMGVPFVTRRGYNMLSRQGESILHNVGLANWIAADNDDYIELLLKRAADLPALAKLRMELRSRLLHSPLCDAPRFANNLAAAFQQMWQEYLRAVGGN